jgi:hypothetical protein
MSRLNLTHGDLKLTHGGGGGDAAGVIAVLALSAVAFVAALAFLRWVEANIGWVILGGVVLIAAAVWAIRAQRARSALRNAEWTARRELIEARDKAEAEVRRALRHQRDLEIAAAQGRAQGEVLGQVVAAAVAAIYGPQPQQSWQAEPVRVVRGEVVK